GDPLRPRGTGPVEADDPCGDGPTPFGGRAVLPRRGPALLLEAANPLVEADVLLLERRRLVHAGRADALHRTGDGGPRVAGWPERGTREVGEQDCGGEDEERRQETTTHQNRCPSTRAGSSAAKSSTHRPAPRATARTGDSATVTGTPRSCRMRSSIPRSRAPPPVRVMPRSRTSPASSGGHRSRTSRTRPMISSRGAAMARRVSAEPMTTVFGSPVT